MNKFLSLIVLLAGCALSPTEVDPTFTVVDEGVITQKRQDIVDIIKWEIHEEFEVQELEPIPDSQDRY